MEKKLGMIRKVLLVLTATLLLAACGDSRGLGKFVQNQKQAEEVVQQWFTVYCNLQNLDRNSFSQPKITSKDKVWIFDFENNADPKSSIRVTIDGAENIQVAPLHPQ